MPSIWQETSRLPEFESLQQDIKTDVLIIGGGIAGILCAYMLGKAGIDYALVEAKSICSGVTKDTTAKITSQHGLIYDKLIREFGAERAGMYLCANEEALEIYRGLCAGIDCDFVEKDAYTYSLDDSEKIDRELEALESIGFRARRSKHLPLPFPVAGAVRFNDQAQFHPLKFLSAIAKGLNIYEHTAVRELKGHTAVTDNANIHAGCIIAATHFPFINKHGSYYLKMYQHRTYEIALADAPALNGMYVNESKTGLSFRNYKDMLLLGGGAHRTGKRGGSFKELEDFAARRYPTSSVVCRWATQDCMTLDGVPYIGHYSKNTPWFYVATGFNKWGMTSSMAAAQLLTDMISGKKNPYEELFSPSRSILRPQLAVNALEAAAGLLTPSNKRCPHLGCALKWNPNERSWDCPCHGSRFQENGNLINNPATGDLKCEKASKDEQPS